MISPVMMCSRSSSLWGNRSNSIHRIMRFVVKKILVVLLGLFALQSAMAEEASKIVTVDFKRNLFTFGFMDSLNQRLIRLFRTLLGANVLTSRVGLHYN